MARGKDITISRSNFTALKKYSDRIVADAIRLRDDRLTKNVEWLDSLIHAMEANLADQEDYPKWHLYFGHGKRNAKRAR